MPLPAIVVMIPVGVIFLILESYSSITYTFPAPSEQMPYGEGKEAAVAGPPSPSEEPPPAKITTCALADTMQPVMAMRRNSIFFTG